MEQNNGYRGSSNLKKANTIIPWSEERIAELQKCADDPIYFAENYMQVVHVDRGLEQIVLYPYQRDIITSVHEENAVVAECARQSGKCVKFDTLINICNKTTGEIMRISIGDFYEFIKQTKSGNP